jgi:hypothetical protein
MAKYDDLLICGSDDATLRFFTINFTEDSDDTGSEVQLNYYGTQNRTGTDKTTFVNCIDNQLIAHGINYNFDIWQFNNQEEIKKRVKKRQKRVRSIISFMYFSWGF